MSINRRGERTRHHVLDAAWDLISEQGAEVSISQIAQAAGISRQAVYQHYGSRGGLLVALVRRADERFKIKEQFDAALAHPGPKERLALTLRAWLAFVPKIDPVARDLIRLRDKDPAASSAWEDRMADLRRWLLALMTSLQKEDALKPGWTPQTAADLFWAQTSVQAWGLLVHECGWREKDVEAKLLRSISDTLLKTDDRDL